MKNNFFKICIHLRCDFLTFSSIANANACKTKKWPCDQVYNPKLQQQQFGKVPPLRKNLKIGGRMTTL